MGTATITSHAAAATVPKASGSYSTTSRASSAQTSGFAKFSGLSTSRRAASLPSLSRSSSSVSSTPLAPSLTPAASGLRQPVPTLTKQEQILQEEEMREHDIQAVQNALYRYKEEPLVSEDEALDLVQWWDVRVPVTFPSP
jgi:hypothetical protein